MRALLHRLACATNILRAMTSMAFRGMKKMCLFFFIVVFLAHVHVDFVSRDSTIMLYYNSVLWEP